jgi:hypothetical protein
MSSTFPATSHNAGVNGVTALGNYVSLHTADPGTTGTAECSGGGYARQATTWGSPSSGTAVGSTVVMTTNQNATYWGVWSAPTGGSFCGGGDLSTTKTGTFTLTVTIVD